ncbi:hypothetical protein JCM10207_008610 [Rhodosporidiobolus poonsookiae]
MAPFPTSHKTPSKPSTESLETTPLSKLVPRPAVPAADEDDKKPLADRSILAIAPRAAPPRAQDEALERLGTGRTSPGKKGKKGGYLLSGIASRAAAVLNAAKTDQMLWLHDVSRSLGTLTFPAPVPSILEIARPALRLVVLSIPPSSASAADEQSGAASRRGGKKTLLAQCRLELDDPSSAPATSAPGFSPSLSSPSRDLIGLVLFSLHLSPTSSALPPPSPIKPARTPAADGRRTLHVPTNPHDLERLVARNGGGAEVWVFEPFYPVDLVPPPRLGEGEAFSLKGVGEALPRPKREDEGGVEWDEEAERKRRMEEECEKNADRSRKALVVGRFAVLV